MSTAPPRTGTRDRAALERLSVHIAAAINIRALYAANHPRVGQAVQAVLAEFAAAVGGQEAIHLFIVGEDLVADDRPLRRSGIYQQNFIQALRRRKVERLTLVRGLDAAQCIQFVSVMASGGTPASTPNLIVGHVELAVGEGAPSGPGGEGRPAGGLFGAQVDDGREAFARFRADRRGSLHKMEEVVWSLMETLARSAHDVIPLAPLKTHDEYTFVHSVNVSLLVLAQGRSFGIQGPMLHALGLAALCHDVGKMSVPLDVLNRPGKLEGDDWKVMQSHAEMGAWQLAAAAEAPALSVVVAYEHHLRFDGLPTYPLLRHPRRPSLASQLTALADTFDAVSTVRPYQKAKARPVALEILRSRAGTFLDPLLVGNFHRLAGGAPPPEAPA
ncbi:MAG TPA: HD domain-containing phosphohydrolase [Vicinamibacteria bacterium]|nr:HD domain-containing phosphohydrolase [Vicinamibacteria bacterium]